MPLTSLTVALPTNNNVMFSRIVFGVFLMTGASVWATDEARSLCTKTETTVFSCEHKKKVASICASFGPDKSLKYVQYRFGKNSAEISIPPTDHFSSDLINAYTTSGAHGGSETISFSAGEYAYQITNIWDMRGPGDTSVTVFKNRSKLSYLPCTLTSDDRLLHSFIDENHFKRGADLQ